MIGYADDSTLVVVVSSPGVNEWCDYCGIKLNASKTKNSLQFTYNASPVSLINY